MSGEKERREWYAAHGICISCGQRDAFPGRKKFAECLEKSTLNNIKYRSVRPKICRSFICSKPLEEAHMERDRIYIGRREHSLRYEVFGNSEVLDFITRILTKEFLNRK